jgi:hypothetical protein
MELGVHQMMAHRSPPKTSRSSCSLFVGGYNALTNSILGRGDATSIGPRKSQRNNDRDMIDPKTHLSEWRVSNVGAVPHLPSNNHVPDFPSLLLGIYPERATQVPRDSQFAAIHGR